MSKDYDRAINIPTKYHKFIVTQEIAGIFYTAIRLPNGGVHATAETKASSVTKAFVRWFKVLIVGTEQKSFSFPTNIND